MTPKPVSFKTLLSKCETDGVKLKPETWAELMGMDANKKYPMFVEDFQHYVYEAVDEVKCLEYEARKEFGK